jgi:hypothetical protein
MLYNCGILMEDEFVAVAFIEDQQQRDSAGHFVGITEIFSLQTKLRLPTNSVRKNLAQADIKSVVEATCDQFGDQRPILERRRASQRSFPSI